MRNIVLTALCALSLAASAQVVTLDSCRNMALRNNKEIQQASLAIDKAGYQRKEAAAAYLPQFDFTAGYVYNSRKVSLIKEDQMLPTKSFNLQTGTWSSTPQRDIPCRSTVSMSHRPWPCCLRAASLITFTT